MLGPTSADLALLSRGYRFSKMRLIPIIVLLLSILAGCERQSHTGLALVNDRSISQDDFIFAYETSPRSVLAGPRQNAYKRVLDGLIQRILLAQEAARRGLQGETVTARELEGLEDAAIRRELFRRSIRDQVAVADPDCRKAFERDQKTLWIQHAVLESLSDVTPGGWDPSWEHVGLNLATKTVERAGFGTLDLISWNDVDLKLEDLLYGLDLGEVSAPIRKNGALHVFRLLNVETNIMTTENQYQEQREHYSNALHKRLEHGLAFKFVQDIMKPEDLIIRRQTLEQLTQVVWQHHPDKDSLSGGSVSELSSPVLELDELNGLELASYRSGTLSVEDFRFYYKMNPYKLRRTSQNELQRDLINAIGIYVRDIVFTSRGRVAGYADAPEVKQDLQYWRERLLASKLKASVAAGLPNSETDTLGTVSKQAEQALADLLLNLKQAAAIHIDEEMLMTIKTSDEGLTRKIDFFAGYLN